MNDITFGRYIARETPIHHLDARNKLLMMILFFVSIFLQFNLWTTNLIIGGIILLFLFVFMLIAKVSLKDLFKSLKGMWFLVLFLLIIYIFLPNSTYTHVAFSIGSYNIYWDSFYQCGYILLRLVMMLCITMILTSTTKPMDLTRGLEWGMTPLKVVRFPAHEIAMTISIALRFIPTILEETKRIMKAQESRGVDFSHGSLKNKFRAIISLIIPLFVSAIERSEELANAMEARGYDPRSKRTHFQKLQFHFIDIIGLFIVLVIFGAVLTLFIIDHNFEVVDIINVIFGVEVGI
ncbi:MAG: energy-coupling factor transporter transmembrane protein EcfT [Erysipelotrichaceae bacterium]|nr:energy-coupling factor transporter transmembrane protein EcfT [Erysipelotrichaceae bacterium]